jgi:hypothetical protein
MNTQFTLETKPEIWMAAAELCAMDLASWSHSESDGLELYLYANDVFVPDADAETLPLELVQEVLSLAKSETDWMKQWEIVLKWVAKRRGYREDEVWFCDRER